MRRIVVLALLLTYIPNQVNAAPSDDALTVLNSLSVKGRAAKTGYTRAQFTHWSDLDRNGCDARNDTLKRDLTEVIYKAGTRDCKVIAGLLIMWWPYLMLGKQGRPTLIKQSDNRLPMIHLIY